MYGTRIRRRSVPPSLHPFYTEDGRSSTIIFWSCSVIVGIMFDTLSPHVRDNNTNVLHNNHLDKIFLLVSVMVPTRHQSLVTRTWFTTSSRLLLHLVTLLNERSTVNSVNNSGLSSSKVSYLSPSPSQKKGPFLHHVRIHTASQVLTSSSPRQNPDRLIQSITSSEFGVRTLKLEWKYTRPSGSFKDSALSQTILDPKLF